MWFRNFNKILNEVINVFVRPQDVVQITLLYKHIKIHVEFVDNPTYFLSLWYLTGFDFVCFRFWFTYASTHLRRRNWRGRMTLVCCLVPSPAGAHPIMQYGGSVRQKYWWHSQDMDWLLPSSDISMVRLKICWTTILICFDFIFWKYS